jgi:hypothetical protein
MSMQIAYFRAAQAYMLISMPTGTSTIFGAFQATSELPGWRHNHRKNYTKSISN